ncbi:methyltransferase domain-containing protein [uncultured Polaribacter sp.]|uniref:methyltransferase domain-containing protein n=1 Tax=uncultured Polaribacter sp. TaxID=174711 RepID=UPI002631E9C4|nr:class I SAM-dependent methyltransferase [uncultured Polaribacter sp.]
MDKEKSSKKIKKPWKTKDAMNQVYEMKLWGSNSAKFYSGDGSHNQEIVKPYIDVVSLFLTSFEKPIVVCDLGCGDFNIGKQLVQHTKKYIAVDIVNELIEYNKSTFVDDKLEFKCLDISKDELPISDCVIIRQVLQHLSNSEVQNIVNKLANYKYVILTEHIPFKDFTPNIDIISGQGIRLKKQSGINLLKPPFNFKVKSEKQVLSNILDKGKGVIVTTIYEVF